MERQFKVLICDEIHPAGLPALKEWCEITHGEHWDRETILKHMHHYDALIVRTETQVDQEMMERGTKLKVVGRAGVGLDNIDTEFAEQHGIVVVNTPGANTISAAEHTIGMMLALARHIPQATGGTRQGRWERQRFMGMELHGKVLGLVGAGRVGSHVASIAHALGMYITAYDPYAESFSADIHTVVDDLELIFLDSDIITVHVPLTDETRGMIDISYLQLVPEGALLINCARGPIVDQASVIYALEKGSLGGYACDVFEHEPVRDPDHPFYKRRNVICTPHIGAMTVDAQERVSKEIVGLVIDNLEEVVKQARYREHDSKVDNLS